MRSFCIKLISAYVFIIGPIALTYAEADLVTQGEKVFNEVADIGCKICHGDFAEGDLGVGPFIRGASRGSIQAAIDAIGEMIAIRHVITEEEVKAVSAYLEYLGGLQVIRTLSKRGRFVPNSAAIHPGTFVQLIIKNSSTQAHHYTSDNMEIEPMEVAGRSTNSLIWQLPQEQGLYTIRCTDCKLDDQFSIEISDKVKPFIGAKPKTRLTNDDQGM